MPTINGRACVVNGTPVDKVYSNGKQVYGRNLLTGTSNTDGTPKVYDMSLEPWGAKNFQVMVGDLKDSFTRNGEGIKLSIGETYVLSFKYKINNFSKLAENKVYAEMPVGTYSATDPIGSYTADMFNPIPYDKETGAAKYAFTVPGKADGLYLSVRTIRIRPDGFDGRNSGISVVISSLKLEKWSVATPWTPAPEDVM